MKHYLKIAGFFIFLILFFYPWISLTLFKIYFLAKSNTEAQSKKVVIETLTKPQSQTPMKVVLIKDFNFSIPNDFELKTTKDEGLTLIFSKPSTKVDENEEIIYAYKGIRATEGFIDSCPQLRDIHTMTLDDLNLFSLNILRSHEIARSLMIKKVSDIGEREYHLYERENTNSSNNLFITVTESSDRVTTIETQKGCDLLTINLINMEPKERVNSLALQIAHSFDL